MIQMIYNIGTTPTRFYMHVKTLPDSLAATSRDAGCGFSIAWMELTVIFVKSLDSGFDY